MPWALSEHIQAQKASPTAKRPETWSAGHVEGADPPELQAFNHMQRAEQPEPVKAMSIQPGCCNGTSPQITRQAAQNCSSEHRASALLQQQRGPAASQPHAVYAALFLSSEQQRLLLDRQGSATCTMIPCMHRYRSSFIVALENSVAISAVKEYVPLSLQGAGKLL
jgi:hypothetical protein